MTIVRLIWLLLAAVWTAAEITLALTNRARLPSFREHDQGSDRLLWRAMGLGLLSALLFKTLHLLPLPGSYALHQFVGLCVFAQGLALRAYAVRTLGNFFTTKVRLADNHRLILSGPYRYVRHPAYSGLLIALVGAGIAMGDALAVLSLILIPAYALVRRIRIEEHVLHNSFGPLYSDYSRTTQRLLPWIW